MLTLKRSAALLVLACALVACSDDAKPSKDTGDEEEKVDAGIEEEEDASKPDEPEDDAGATTAPVPLTVWVDDLVEHHTTDDAEPDTVDDKVISDDTDETSFDKYLP